MGAGACRASHRNNSPCPAGVLGTWVCRRFPVTSTHTTASFAFATSMPTTGSMRRSFGTRGTSGVTLAHAGSAMRYAAFDTVRPGATSGASTAALRDRLAASGTNQRVDALTQASLSKRLTGQPVKPRSATYKGVEGQENGLYTAQ